MLKVGSRVPDFELNDQDNNIVKINRFRGQKVFLWFFPKASTPG